MGVFEVYRLISPSGKSYIGLTCQTLFIRWQQHIRSWKSGKGKSSKLYDAFKKYPPELWIREVIGFAENEKLAQELEIKAIELHNSIANGYNLQLGGNLGGLGCKRSIKFCQDRSKKYSGLGNPNFGKKHSEDTKEKIRQKRLGSKASSETKKLLSEQRKGNKHRLGISFSQEQKQKIAIAVSKAKLGVKRPPLTEEWKKKISESGKKAWEKRRNVN